MLVHSKQKRFVTCRSLLTGSMGFYSLDLHRNGGVAYLHENFYQQSHLFTPPTMEQIAHVVEHTDLQGN